MDAKDDNVDVSEIKVSEFSMFRNDEKLWLGVFLLVDKDEQDYKVQNRHEHEALSNTEPVSFLFYIYCSLRSYIEHRDAALTRQSLER